MPGKTTRATDIAYVIGTYPLLTTTFIDREIDIVNASGRSVRVISLRRPHGMLADEQSARSDTVDYIEPVSTTRHVGNHLRFLATRPARYLATLVYLVTRHHPNRRARLRSVLHFGQGVEVAALLQRAPLPQRIHAHFVDRAATSALVAGRLLDVDYSVTAHANDIYVDPVLLPEKLANAQSVVTCTEYNAEHLRQVAPDAAAKIATIYHGLDTSGYQPPTRQAGDRLRMLAVGQLKEKKGFDDLIRACETLHGDGHNIECTIIGEGPLRSELESQIDAAGLTSRVRLTGALAHAEVIDHYRSADLFVLPCVTASDGDRDGIPNVILEAMAMQLPVVSTDHSGIPEAVEHDDTGLLVPQRDPAALARALDSLARDPERRSAMGRAARQVVVELFDVHANVGRFIDTLAIATPSTIDGVFIAWTSSRRGSRSQAMGDALGIDVYHLSVTARRGAASAMVKYPATTAATLAVLLKRWPQVVFVQSPPSIAPLLVAVGAVLTRRRFVVDAHTDALVNPRWTKPQWLYRWLTRRAAATIVTNEHLAAMIERLGGRALVVPDIPTSFPDGSYQVEPGFNIAAVNTFASDEPLDQVIEAARELDDVTFHVTGDLSRARAETLARAPGNVRFTGFLDRGDYYTMLRECDAVMCLTTRDHTMQRGACEALSLGRPIITSDWPVLREYFSAGTIHVDNSAGSIRRAVDTMRADIETYRAGINELQQIQRDRWSATRAALYELVGSSNVGRAKR